MDPTVEPDPDNAGGGKKAMHTTPSAEGVFYFFASKTVQSSSHSRKRIKQGD